MQKGTVFWLTGLAGSGKTTIGKELYKTLKSTKPNIVLLDGDELRAVFGNDLGYTLSDRLTCAKRYSMICRLLSQQGIDVIMCTISMFDEIREWNRQNIPNYKEVYIKVPIDILKQRNQKGLYNSRESHKNNVVGLDLEVQLPKNPDVIIENTGVQSLKELVNIILSTSVTHIN